MSELFGYVRDSAIVADRDLQEFDGCKVRIMVMDKNKRSELENLFGLWKHHDNGMSVDDTVRNMRKGRVF